MCRELDVSRSGFYAWTARSQSARETGLSRNTVKRYLRNAVLEHH